MNKNAGIYVAGHKGMVGSAIYRLLEEKGYSNIIVRSSKELDLRNQADVNIFFQEEKPEYVFLSAAKVGGIHANNTYPAEFIYDNMAIALNVIEASRLNGVKKLMNLGSSCIYPKFAGQPMKEEYLLSGELEPTNEAYAIAKISAIKLCNYYNKQYGTNYLSVMPTNLYGPGDNYDLQNSHVLPALIRKFHEAKEANGKVILWGDGSPKREFLYSYDLAEAVVYLMENYNAEDLGEFINVGTGKDIEIKELANLVAKTIGYSAEIEWDATKPNGTPRKLLDVTRLHKLGWKASTKLSDGIRLAYADFLKQQNS